MKKLAALLMAVIMALGISACSRNKGTTNQGNTNGTGTTGNGTTNGTTGNGTSNGNNTTGKYKDGTYTGKGDTWEHGSEEAIVEIKGGKISSINLRRLDKEGKEVDYEAWQGQEVNGKTYPNLKKYRMDMANMMIEKQSANVDTISGATVSTLNWKIATERALEQAMK